MPEISPSKFLVNAGWNDVPHLDEKTKAELLEATPPHMREARTQGWPGQGIGAIYPIPWNEVSVEPIKIPTFWPRAYGLDVGWKKTAALWSAHDRESDILYFYAEHYRGQAEPSIHATAIKARGEWIPGTIDPAARGRSQIDGTQLIQIYADLGLILTPANNEVEAGLYLVWERLSTGRIKFFKTLVNTRFEYENYHRDENGRVVKEDDHLMDTLRYLTRMAPEIECIEPGATTHRARGGRGDQRAGY